MAGTLSDYTKNMLRTGLFRTGAFVKPGGLYAALFTATPADAGGGTEVAGGAYVRVQVGPSDAAWSAHATAGRTQNVAAIAWPTPPSANWGAVGWMAFFDASSAGNMIMWGPLATPRVVNLGDPAPSFPADTCDYQWD